MCVCERERETICVYLAFCEKLFHSVKYCTLPYLLIRQPCSQQLI